MKLITASFVVAFTMVCSWPLMADNSCSILTTPYTATYYGSYKGWRLDTTQQLKQLDKNKWRFELQADNPIGKLNQRSDFLINAENKIESVHYRSLRKIFFKEDRMDIDFNWVTRQATTSKDEKNYTLPLQGGELDDLSYQLAIRCDLLNGLRVFSYRNTDRKEINTLDFKIIGEEKLKTELGEFNTVVVKRIRNNKNRTTTMWFAKDLDYLMVKLLQEELKDTEAYLLYIQQLEK